MIAQRFASFMLGNVAVWVRCPFFCTRTRYVVTPELDVCVLIVAIAELLNCLTIEGIEMDSKDNEETTGAISTEKPTPFLHVDKHGQGF